MVTGIIGRKVGMTQVFAQDGTVSPATVIKAGPCVVVQAKAPATDGYEAVQLGLVEEKPARLRKPLAGHYQKAGVPPTRVRREVKLAAGAEALKAGDQVLVAGVFNSGDRVDVIGISRGKGFQGVVRRHHFRGGAATHGSMFHRAPGSIGASSFPSRVVKGMRAGGRMGGDRVTVRNLKVVQVDGDLGLVFEHTCCEAGTAVHAAGRRELDDVRAAVDLTADDAAAAFDAVTEIFRARIPMCDEIVVQRPAPVHVTAGGRDRLSRIDDARPLHPSALHGLAESQSVAVLVAEVADRGEAGAQGLHTVHLGFERVERPVVANLGQKLLLAAPIANQVNVAVDQSGQDSFVAKLDRRGSSRRRHVTIANFDDPAVVDDDRRRPGRRLAGNSNQPAGMDVGRCSECGGGSARSEGD